MSHEIRLVRIVKRRLMQQGHIQLMHGNGVGIRYRCHCGFVEDGDETIIKHFWRAHQLLYKRIRAECAE